MRLIDADELKKEILKWLPSDPCGIEEKEIPFETDIVVSLMMEIEEAPTIEPKQGEWIPCSERMPEEDGRYYVTRQDYVTQTDFTDILWYEKGLWWNRQSIGDYAVIAWMPLPEPYMKGEDDA